MLKDLVCPPAGRRDAKTLIPQLGELAVRFYASLSMNENGNGKDFSPCCRRFETIEGSSSRRTRLTTRHDKTGFLLAQISDETRCPIIVLNVSTQ